MNFSIRLENFKRRGCPQLDSSYYSLIVAAFFVIFYNASFFGNVGELIDYTSLRGCIFIINISLLILVLTFIVVSVFTLPYIAKPIISIVFITAACVAYFMDAYGIVIHRLMIQNLVETDLVEVKGLLNIRLLLYVLSLGFFPSVLMFYVTIKFDKFKPELWKKIKHIALAFTVGIVLIMTMSQDYASFFRNHKAVRQMVNPINFIYAGISYLTTSNRVIDVKPIENDASITPAGKAHIKPTLFILVVGETARADHFGINGYDRDTTPLLAKQDIINFSNVTSCGTETAVSVPCMFSVLGRKNYSNNKAKAQEGLLDVVSHAGISVLWRDNNSSCKGACDRVSFEDVRHLQVPELCNERECFDEILLHQLNEKVSAMKGSKLIVLHQKGSHGPDYFNRYPPSSEYFSPACKDNQLQNCAKEDLVNAFDNTIRYTDYFLNSTIKWLSGQNAEYNTSLLYLSDHGESLGEKNLYLHGMPYAIAPKEQTHVPFFLWLSQDFETANAIDRSCLKKISNDPYSHDNLFHTVLGILNVSTNVYKADLDIIKPCRNISIH
ncbi:MAG TPA: phosphoethanolamine--lipid A transferase [Cellvibrio sp.]|nr:phosphoethanolamine--lipid A transferase [Cellvibrio sp.]